MQETAVASWASPAASCFGAAEESSSATANCPWESPCDVGAASLQEAFLGRPFEHPEAWAFPAVSWECDRAAHSDIAAAFAAARDDASWGLSAS